MIKTEVESSVFCYYVIMKPGPTIDAYDRYAKIYDQEVIEFWDNFPQSFVGAFVEMAPSGRILNLGSGSGRDAMLLRDKGLEVVCLDASKAMIEITTGLGFESHHGTFDEMNFPDSTFDAVWAYTSLIHVPKEQAKNVIKKIKHILRPEGAFAIGVIRGPGDGMVERITMPGASRYFKNYTSDELKSMIQPLGFTFLEEQEYKPHNSIYLNQLYIADS